MKLMQILKNRKGFTLMELIVVLIIIAILMAALLPSLIGWINDAREAALRTDGRTALLAVQSVATQAKGTGYWSTPDRDRYVEFDEDLLKLDTRFADLIAEADVYGGTVDGALGGIANTTEGIVEIITENDNVIGLEIANTVGDNRNSDGIGPGVLLVGRAEESPEGP